MKKTSSVYIEDATGGSPGGSKAHMGLFSGIAMIAGLIIGAGIFATSSGSFVKAGGSVGANLLLWVFAGLLSALGGLCYVELGCAMPQSGGEHVYLNKAYGPWVAYVFDWTMAVIGFPILTASMVLICSDYVYGLVNMNPEIAENYLIGRIIACGLITLICLLNMISARVGSRVSDLFTILKMGALILIIGVGVYFLATGHVDNFKNAFQTHGFVKDEEDNNVMVKDSHPEVSLWSYAGALYFQLFAYSGWNNLNYMVGELKNPTRNLPLAIIISMSFVITVYALLTISYFAVLPLEVIGATKIIATKVGEVAMGQAGIIVIPILVICSAFGATNASIYSNSRLIAASAEEGILLPKVLAKSVQLFNKTNVATSNNNSIASSSSSSLNGTAAAPAATTTTETFSEGSDAPVNSLILTCILTCGFCWVPELDTLIDISSFIQCIFTFLAVAGLIVLRYTHPEMHRPFRVFTPCAYLFCLVTLGLIIYPIADAIMDQSFDKAMPFLISIGLMLLPLPMIYYGVKRRADAFVY